LNWKFRKFLKVDKMPEKRLDAVVVGELNIDLVLWEVPMPEYEKEMLAKDMRFAMGSSSAITAHNLSAIGSRVGFIGKAGKDNFGDFMIEGLKRGGVETSGILQETTLKTGATIVLANPPKKALLTYMGAMTDLTIDDIDWDYIAQARHLHLGCFFLQTGIRKDVGKLFARAKEMGLTTSMDTNWDPADEWGEDLKQALKYCDIFFPNDDEALRIARSKNLGDAVEKLQKIVRVLAVKKGKTGAIVCTEGKTYIHKGFEVKAIETTGAGDSFNAGFLHKFLEGADWETCLCWGNACGANAVTALGGTGAFVDREKVKLKLEDFLKNDQPA
jgi:sugar/nucleoside kinase (ribokinase family)